ncbi:hypothetical protein ACOSQ3_021462 [Xanthoceras sorbifolium]
MAALIFSSSPTASSSFLLLPSAGLSFSLLFFPSFSLADLSASAVFCVFCFFSLHLLVEVPLIYKYIYKIHIFFVPPTLNLDLYLVCFCFHFDLFSLCFSSICF